ncbi:MAG: DUF4224 domain-containing protein [Burkholderiales bacterium]|nr:MAG: DUF4224 domain-containing protein [Betaproteobacteria bacterium]TAG84589.1 MAG: DUF4224 domain-containing protein [Burkholderiales bacterium]
MPEALLGSGLPRTCPGQVAFGTHWLLSADDLFALTGYRLATAQRRWLDRQGLPYLLDAANRPRVSREAVERLLGVLPASEYVDRQHRNAQTVAQPSKRPDFTALLSLSDRTTKITAASAARSSIARNPVRGGRSGS